MPSLHKKIKYLNVKRRALPYIYYLTFGGGWVLGFIYSNFIFVVLLSGVGMVFFILNERYWERGEGHVVISVSFEGVLQYEYLFKKDNHLRLVPIINWDEVESFKLTKASGESIFCIYLTNALSDNLTIENILLPKMLKKLKNNKETFGAEIVLHATDFQPNDYVEFVDEFRELFNNSSHNKTAFGRG